MTEIAQALIKAVLVRAADVEAKRQDAIRRGDDAARAGFERELQKLYHEHRKLEAAGSCDSR